MSMDQEVARVVALLLQDNKKEYLCHLRYVAEIGVRLAKAQGNINIPMITVACLLHDIGRDKELSGETHAQTGRRIAEGILKDSAFNEEEKQVIYRCIEAHNMDDEVPESIEEQIVRSADAGSKVEYHEAFMLMCKKVTYEERLAWGMKYLEKGFRKVSIDSYKQELLPKYQSIHTVYESIAKNI
jgi:HD superfamily phosphodiesterase